MPTLAHRCHPATSRNSCTVGVNADCAAFQALQDLVVVLLGGQLRQRTERGAHVAQRTLAGFQRQILTGGERLDTRPRVCCSLVSASRRAFCSCSRAATSRAANAASGVRIHSLRRRRPPRSAR
jgi:hypothetical protein